MLPHIDHHQQKQNAHGHGEDAHLAPPLRVVGLHNAAVVDVLDEEDLGSGSAAGALLHLEQLAVALCTRLQRIIHASRAHSEDCSLLCHRCCRHRPSFSFVLIFCTCSPFPVSCPLFPAFQPTASLRFSTAGSASAPALPQPSASSSALAKPCSARPRETRL